MAKITEDVLVIKLSKLAKDSDPATCLVTSEHETIIEQLVQEVLGAGIIVEVAKA